jgi:hypothetical protein
MLKLNGIFFRTALTMTLVAGCASVEEDGRDDSFLTGGKADSAGIEEGSPQALGVLDVANTASIEELEDLPLSSRAVDNLMYFRLGDDGRPGTDDDGVFRSLAELDAIPFIGPIALQRLLAFAEAKGYVDAHRTAVKLTFDGLITPSLVAVRDGLTGGWRRAEAGSPKTALLSLMEFQAKVADRYVVAYVCEDPATRSVSVYEEGRTLEDGDFASSCDFATGPQVGRVSGSMQQAGAVALGQTSARSSSDGWSFDLGSPAGTFDLVASSVDRVAIRRAIKVAGDVALSSKLDLALEGTALAPLAFTATNATMTENVVADIRLSTSSTFSAGIYRGAAGAARIVPGSILAANDRQTASIRGIDGGKFRALRRPVNAMTNTVFTLPQPIGEKFALENGRFVVTWGSLLPSLSYLAIDAQNFSDGQTGLQVYHSFDVTPAFVQAASLARLTLDIDLPDFKPEWRIDFTREYYRDIFVQSFANGEIATIQNSEYLNAPTVAPTPGRGPSIELHRGAAQP